MGMLRLQPQSLRLPHMLIFCCVASAIAFAVLGAVVLTAADESPKDPGNAPAAKQPAKKSEPVDAKTALAEFNSLIGKWRGVGMPKRNSQDGAWFETAEWV